ncbi:hypothetical protein AB0G02_18745 [Actinosynnema sp. NPDC023658]|uniref:hypothetical protein n=1 Tax=Actinosynnema sp. NPDC023658 TaxID=3155465 RepID=UPI0033ED46DB
MSRYEELLGLPPLLLTATGEAVGRFLNGERGEISVTSEDGALHRLLDQARSPGCMSGEDWRTLTRLIAGRPGMVLHPPGLWRTITDNLISELVVAEHTSWLFRQEAMSRLLEHPVSARHAFAACVEMADDRTNPACVEPISLLDATTLPEASRYVIRQLNDPDDSQALQGALLAAVAKVRRGHFGAVDMMELPRIIGTVAAANEDHPVIAPLGAELDKLLRARSGILSRSHAVVGMRLALATRANLAVDEPEPDEVLAELIAEAIYGGNPDERLYATALITATPYRLPLANAVAEWVKTSGVREELSVERGLQLLGRLRVATHRSLVSALLADQTLSARNRHAAAWSAAHSKGRFTAMTWRAIVGRQIGIMRRRPSPLDERILCGLVYSIGTDSHASLLRELGRDRELTPKAQQLARWWAERQGPLVDSASPA